MRSRIRHHLNALHVMALLIRCGCSQSKALTIARRWEAFIHPWLYGAQSR
jgi:hypothetical protein